MWQAGSIVSKLELNTSNFVQGMMTAQAIGRLFPSFVTSFMANPLLGLVDVLKSASSAVVGFFKETLNSAIELQDMAEAVGVSGTKIAELASIVGGGHEALNDVSEAFKFLARSADDAARGNETALANFQRLGISAAQIKEGLADLPGLMMRVGDGMRNLPDSASRVSISMDVLGRAGNKMIEILGQGSDAMREQIAQAYRYGAILSETALETGDSWKKSMIQIQLAWQGFKNVVGEALMNSLQPVIERYTSWVREHPETVRQVAQQIAAYISALAQEIVAKIEVVMQNLQRAAVLIAAIRGGLSGGAYGSAWGPVGTVTGTIVGATVAGGGMYAATEWAKPNISYHTHNYQATVNTSSVAEAAKTDYEQWKQKIREAIEWDKKREDTKQRVRLNMAF